ncbi:farnesyltranstransferase [Saccharomycopsis crataegensis]|uniref:Farnesyltranstransferase n=1 Tax=Saccharomycopsis crataegensis TaxID=43959 RepID=A0AAV5QVK8_9ASCO|nr:farnesyltranstransferase [Saccharomycopsis crataegensis]
MDIDVSALKSAPKWSEDNEKIIREPFDYLKSSNGKEFRTALIDSFNQILKVPSADLQTITQIIGILHNASLLVDDVEDGSKLRRGNPVAHEIFGVAMTINTANYMYFKAFQKALELGSEAVEILNEEFLNLHRGQALDLYWRESLICPTEEEYVDMVMNKTGGLFRLSIRLMEQKSHLTSIQKSFVPLVNLLGISYQIKDDYINLSNTQYFTNKGYCEDLKEGKFSFPIIHAIRYDQSNKEVISILSKRTDDVELKNHVVTYMKTVSKSFEYCEATLQKLEANAILLMNEIVNENPDFKEDTKSIELLKVIIKKICAL